MGNNNSGKQKIIGRVERVGFPEWDLFDVNAKVDTGAYTSSLHCHRIEIFEKEGKPYVSFELPDPAHKTDEGKNIEIPVYRRKVVKSSNGIAEERYIVKVKMLIGNLEVPIDLSLTDRSGMKYPVLLGRKAIKGRFIVDVSEKFLTNRSRDRRAGTDR